MNYKKKWSDAKLEYNYEYKVAKLGLSKLKKQLKKANKDIKKSDSKRTVSAEDIEALEKSLESLSAFKRKKTGLEGAFVNIDKVLSKMEAMKAGGVHPVAHRKHWVKAWKLNSKAVAEGNKGRRKLVVKMGDEAKYRAKGFDPKIVTYVKFFPPKNRACQRLIGEADEIFEDINKRINSLHMFCNFKAGDTVIV